MFGEDELRQLLDFCERHGLVLCSDDVHSKMVIDRSKEHVPVAKLADAFVDRTMTLLSSTKTYNISGTGCAAAVIPSPEIRKAFAAMGPDPIHLISPLSRAATLAALEDSSSYVSELQEALRANWRAVGDAFDALDGVWLTDAESTYNAWVNVKDLGLKSPVGYFMKHGVHLADGKGYGASGYVRMNFACPPKTLDEGLRRIRAGIESL